MSLLKEREAQRNCILSIVRDIRNLNFKAYEGNAFWQQMKRTLMQYHVVIENQRQSFGECTYGGENAPELSSFGCCMHSWGEREMADLTQLLYSLPNLIAEDAAP